MTCVGGDDAPPTAVPVFPSVKKTLTSGSVVPLVWDVQVVPPSVVLRMVPPTPTAQPVFASTKDALKSAHVTPLVSDVQVVPPSDVLSMVPSSPNSHHVLVSTHEISYR